MSIILTAGKKAVKKQCCKPKPKKKRSASAPKVFNPTPPLSSSRTTVWHWNLQDCPTTVMYSKENNEVWCNGEVVETVEGFDPECDGGVIDFCIILEETGSAHKARIKRVTHNEGMVHLLFVDNIEILEHTRSDYQAYNDGEYVSDPNVYADDPTGYYAENDPSVYASDSMGADYSGHPAPDYTSSMDMYDGLGPPPGDPDNLGAYGAPPPPYYEDPDYSHYNGENKKTK